MIKFNWEKNHEEKNPPTCQIGLKDRSYSSLDSQVDFHVSFRQGPSPHSIHRFWETTQIFKNLLIYSLGFSIWNCFCSSCLFVLRVGWVLGLFPPLLVMNLRESLKKKPNVLSSEKGRGGYRFGTPSKFIGISKLTHSRTTQYLWSAWWP